MNLTWLKQRPTEALEIGTIAINLAAVKK